jgi:EAL and modified HD-GYP domain-containing signal transduction protein
MDLLLSRHPIYSSKVDVAGYEIRSRVIDSARVPPGSTPYSGLTEEAIAQLVGDHVCYVNITPEALENGWWKTLPVSKAVLGFYDMFAPDSVVAKELLQIWRDGNRLALSGGLGGESLDLFGGSLFAVKFDVTAFTPAELKAQYKALRPRKTQLLASRVDTYDDLEYCRSLGFDLYEGNFISRASATREQDIPVNRLTMLRVLSKLQQPDLEMTELERAVCTDAALSYRLLTFANSAAIALPKKVESIGHAVRMVGVDKLRGWASALLLSSVDDKPRELLTIALVRARMCELLAASLKGAKKEAFFSTGLLSVIDALLDCPMQKALDRLPLSDEVKAALVGRTGPAGEALRCAVAYERADWDDVQFYGLAERPIRDIYMDSICWARKLSAGLLN